VKSVIVAVREEYQESGTISHNSRKQQGVKLFFPVFSPGFKKKKEFFGFGETLCLKQMVKHFFTEGTVPVPPNRPSVFAIVSYYPLWSYRFRGVPQRRGGGIPYCSPKERQEKYFEDFY
jgi:hypothetical protein